MHTSRLRVVKSDRYETFEDFWPFYVSEHLHPATRALHYLGTTVSLVLIVLGAVLTQPVLFFAAVFAGYFFAWIGHFFVEKNRPATFTYPLYSLLGDYRMYWLALRGKMGAQVAAVEASGRFAD